MNHRGPQGESKFEEDDKDETRASAPTNKQTEMHTKIPKAKNEKTRKNGRIKCSSTNEQNVRGKYRKKKQQQR